MEEEDLSNSSSKPRVVGERSLTEEAEMEDKVGEKADIVSESIDAQTEESLPLYGDCNKEETPAVGYETSNDMQLNLNEENEGAVIISHANGENTDKAESTESFEFANGSDETSSWESFSGHDIEEAEAMFHQDEVSMAHSARLMERSTHTDTKLPENVVKIETEDGCKVYIIGTAHFSIASQEDVSQTIQAVCPDVVMVELCSGRIGIIKYDEETLLREAKDLSLVKLKMAIKESGVVGGVMQLLLFSMSAHLTKELGMAPGGEFRRAIKEAKRIPGCQIILGDRPVQITLSRVMATLSFWQKLRMGWHLLTSRDPISKEDIEKFKQKDMIAEMLKEMTGDYPTLTEVFVTERDLYMAHVLRNAARPVTIVDENGEVIGHEPGVVVGVVGLGHLNGIKENFGKQVDIEELLRVPKPSVSSKMFKLTFRAILVAALSWGVFKFVKWTGVYK